MSVCLYVCSVCVSIHVAFKKIKNIYIITYLFLAVLGLGCCMGTSSSCSDQGLLFVAAHRLLISAYSLCGEQALGSGAW